MNVSTEPHAVSILRQKKIRVTAPRVAVMTTLLQAGCPLSQQQIAERLGSSAPDKTTIYRTLLSLAEEGLVHKAFVQQRQWHFETAEHCTDSQCHPHFTCVRCRRTECLIGVETPLVTLPEGMTMHRQQVRVEGVCATCCK